MVRPTMDFYNLNREDVSWDDLVSVEELADEFDADIDPKNALASSEIGSRVIEPILEQAGWKDSGYQVRFGREAGGTMEEAERMPTLIPVNGSTVDADFAVVEENWELRTDISARDYSIIGEVKEPEAVNPKRLLKKAIDDALKYTRLTASRIGIITNGRYLGFVVPVRTQQEALIRTDSVDDLVRQLLDPDTLLDDNWYFNDFLVDANVADPEDRLDELQEESREQTIAEKRPISEISDVLTENYNRVYDLLDETYTDLEDTEFVNLAWEAWLDMRSSMPETMRETDSFLQETVYDLTVKLLALKVARDYELIEQDDVGEHIIDDAPDTIKTFVAEIQGTSEILPALKMDILSWWIPSEKQWEAMDEDDQDYLMEKLETIAERISDARDRLEPFNTDELNRDRIGDIYEQHIPAEQRRRMGEYYTPVKIVENVLAEVGYGNLDRDVSQETLLDPACGSGTFLVRATRNLRAWMELREGLDAENQDDAIEIVETIEENICGLDINPFAVHLAQINIFLTNVDIIKTSGKSDIDFNIYSADTLKRGEYEGPLFDFADEFVGNGRIQNQIDEMEGADALKQKEYNYVVGNPPYTSRFHDAYEDVLDQYSVDNLAHAFWKRITRNFAKDDTHIGLVMPMDFVTGTESGELARRWLTDKDMDVTIIDPAYYRAFYVNSEEAKVNVVCQM